LKSLIEQSYQPAEIVVLDNGSTDGSAEAIESEFPQATLIRMPKNYGDWQGRDIAAANALGDYLFFVDNDGFLGPDSTANMMAKMLADERIAVAQAKVLDPNTGRPEGTAGSSDLAELDHYKATFLGGAAIIRGDVFRKVGGFPHYLLGGGEPFVSYRVLDLGLRILHCSDAVLFHAQSKLERVPAQRLFLSSKQRLRATMSHYPGLVRPLVELTWKLMNYGWVAARNGYLLRIPKDLLEMSIAGVKEWRGDWIIKPSTVHLIDHLRGHVIHTREDYDVLADSRLRGKWLDYVQRRWFLR
jgi:GT2 family glycosyltransferase